MAERTWKCQKQSNGIKCGYINPRRKQICARCNKRRPATKKPAHMAVLSEVTYEQCVAKWGEQCGICGVSRKPGSKRLARDHDHRTGKLRGLLCTRCNRALHTYMDLEWTQRAVNYLQKSEDDPLIID